MQAQQWAGKYLSGTIQTQTHTLICATTRVCVCMPLVDARSFLPVAASPATEAVCRSNPRAPESPPPPREIRSSPGARHATQRGSGSDSAAPRSAPYTEITYIMRVFLLFR